MARPFSARIADEAASILLALFFVSLTLFSNAEPIVRTGPTGRTPHVLVNHQLKGDRLPVDLRDTNRKQKYHQEIPVGCEPAFSPIAAPRLANFYGRCIG